MEVKSASAVDVFQVFAAVEQDTKTYVIDIRPHKDFKKKHILQAYSIRLAANGKALLDYSKNEYHHPWSQDCWWDKHAIVYGDADKHKANKIHAVVAYLVQDNHAKSLSVFKQGFEIFDKAFPFLCTASIKANAFKRFPAAIVPGLLYLGGWDAAEDKDRLQELNIKRILTVHNHPENLKETAGCQHLKYALPDVDTADIAPLFAPSFQFIEEARGQNHGVLVHCGAGASRSAAICMAYLMRASGWSAEQARTHCQMRRSLVNPNEGFWRALCLYEQELGIDARSDPGTMAGNHGADAMANEVPEAVARKGVVVSFKPVPVAGDNQPRGSKTSVPAPAVSPSGRGNAERAHQDERPSKRSRRDDEDDNHKPQHSQQDREKDRNRHRDRERDRDRDRNRDRDRDRDQARDRERDRDRDRRRDGDRDRDRDRDRHANSSSNGKHRAGDALGLERSHPERDKGEEGERSRARHGDAPESDGRGEPAATTPPLADGAEAGVELEVTREGKILGRTAIALTAGQRCIIGRDFTPGACDLVLEHASVSRRHAHLSAGAAGTLTLTDLGSAHGTNVDGLWLRPNTPRHLKIGAILKFGGSTRTYEVKSLPPS